MMRSVRRAVDFCAGQYRSRVSRTSHSRHEQFESGELFVYLFESDVALVPPLVVCSELTRHG